MIRYLPRILVIDGRTNGPIVIARFEQNILSYNNRTVQAPPKVADS